MAYFPPCLPGFFFPFALFDLPLLLDLLLLLDLEAAFFLGAFFPLEEDFLDLVDFDLLFDDFLLLDDLERLFEPFFLGAFLAFDLDFDPFLDLEADLAFFGLDDDLDFLLDFDLVDADLFDDLLEAFFSFLALLDLPLDEDFFFLPPEALLGFFSFGTTGLYLAFHSAFFTSHTFFSAS